jgi:hypothetical protein
MVKKQECRCYYAITKPCKRCKSQTGTNTSKSKIKHRSSANSVPPADFSTKTKELMLERDGWCIIWWDCAEWLVAHHCYFSNNANRTSTRNNLDQWVTLCGRHHFQLHNPTEDKHKTYKWKTILYLQ